MKIIIAGSRGIVDPHFLYPTLDNYFLYVTEVVCGGASGVDSIGAQWAYDNWIPIKYFYADWNQFGKSAGYRRNVEMGKYADGLLAFWDGRSDGTRHMFEIMHKLNKPYAVYVL